MSRPPSPVHATATHSHKIEGDAGGQGQQEQEHAHEQHARCRAVGVQQVHFGPRAGVEPHEQHAHLCVRGGGGRGRGSVSQRGAVVDDDAWRRMEMLDNKTRHHFRFFFFRLPS